MTWDIATGRLRIGLAAGDVSKDAEITLAMNQALALAETYCDRQFMYATNETKFYYVNGRVFQLTRYPLEAVTSNMSGDFKIHHAGGWIKYATPIKGDELKITYSGGYKVLPADLELALWTIFDTTHGAMMGAAVTTGGIKSASVTGVGSVQFDTGSGASSTGGGQMGGLLPATAASILDLYRREYA